MSAGEGLSGGTSVNGSFKLGAYAGRLDNIDLAGIDNPSPNLTTVYLDTPLVGPTPDPLEYVPSPGRLGQPRGCPPSSTRPYSRGARRRHPPPPPPYNTDPPMRPSIGRAQPRRGIHATGLRKVSNISAPRGNPLQSFVPRVWRGLTPPHTFTSTGGRAGKCLEMRYERQRTLEKFAF